MKKLFLTTLITLFLLSTTAFAENLYLVCDPQDDNRITHYELMLNDQIILATMETLDNNTVRIKHLVSNLPDGHYIAKARAGSGIDLSDWSNECIFDIGVPIPLTAPTNLQLITIEEEPVKLSQENWTLLYVNSEETIQANTPATKAFDGDSNTQWHTEWAGMAHPHEIQIDLEATYSINELSYLPRQDNSENGMVKDYEIYISNDTSSWGEPIVIGTYPSSKEAQITTFLPIEGRYLKFVALSEINNERWTAIAEINLMGTLK